MSTARSDADEESPQRSIVDIIRHSMAGKKGQKKRFWADEEKRSSRMAYYSASKPHHILQG
jgi:hypothetical protein